MITQKDWDEEKAYLGFVDAIIKERLKLSEAEVSSSRQEVIDTHKTMMDDVGNDVSSLGKFVDAYAYLVEIERSAYVMNMYQEANRRLLKMADSPYFGRLDFDFGDNDIMKIYIGIGSLHDEDTMKFYVFDWRSPVAGMYYDCEIGSASYTAPQGVIKGEILLKRHFKTWRGEILTMYDSSVTIEDQVLQEALSKSADSKMQSIVTSIQREQNQVIRDRSSKALIAFGPAGSGKTSVAMQRIAFLLYTYRETIKSKNVMIFAPNNLFGDYISEVLPQLGEENIRSLTFSSYAALVFKDKYRFVNSGEMLEYCMDNEGVRNRGIKIKLSRELQSQLLEAVSKTPQFINVYFNETLVMTKEQMHKLYTEDYAYLKPQQRLNKLQTRLVSLLKPLKRKRAAQLVAKVDPEQDPILVKEQKILAKLKARTEFKDVLHEIEKICKINEAEIYIKVLKKIDKDVAADTLDIFEQGFVRYEDAAPILYIFASCNDIKNDIKHVIIDEAQDYSHLQYACIKLCFHNARMTILGDENQVVNALAEGTRAEEIAEIFADKEPTVLNLSKSYRSTKQISEYCQKILGLSNMDYMHRDGEPPLERSFSSKEKMYEQIQLDLDELRKNGRTVAIISRNAAESEEISNFIKNAHLVRSNDRDYETGAVIIPSYMAKGLEFDAVLIPKNSFIKDSKVFYTVCTRALHVLRLYEVEGE